MAKEAPHETAPDRNAALLGMDDSRVGNRRSSNRYLRAAASSATCWGFVMNKDNAKDYLLLVQALADGKAIQSCNWVGDWQDINGRVDFLMPPANYRIKPEPKEIWMNRYPNGAHFGPFDSKQDAHWGCANDTAIQVCFREVIE